MSRPKNRVTLTPRNKDKTMYDIWYYDDRGNKIRVTASTTTILKGVLIAKRTYDIDMPKMIGG
jgi:hypothetical protein